MSAPPTVCRVVLLQWPNPEESETAVGLAPAIVSSTNSNGTLNVVAFSDRWPLTAARAFRNVPHADMLRVDRAHRGPVWLWPPRTDPPAASSSPEMSRELAALTRALAAVAVRVGELEAAARSRLRGIDSTPP